MNNWNIINAECLCEMQKMDADSIDFIVTDPPYGLSFMGKSWDKSTPAQDIWKEALRICKPGAMLAAFGGSRTHHRLMLSLEQAGWEIRDVIMWLYSSGFPKSHNNFGLEGYGTALKPAYEPIILAMKPLDGTFAQNAEKWGLAGINIDESRIDSELLEGRLRHGGGKKSEHIKQLNPEARNSMPSGRWPANIIFDEEAAQMLGQLSRFFYCAKASSKERNKGLEGLPLKECHRFGSGLGEGNHPQSPTIKRNNHPTVKPIALMKYIIKLLAPPNNPTLLDPFVGSGSTLLAAQELGINSIGIEMNKEYCDIAEARLQEHDKQLKFKFQE